MPSRQVWKDYGACVPHPADFSLSVSMVISHFKKSTLVHDSQASSNLKMMLITAAYDKK